MLKPSRQSIDDGALTCSVSRFLEIAGIGLTTAYRLINDGTIQTVAIGRKRLIVLDSYRRLLEQQLAQPSTTAPLNTPPRPRRPGRNSVEARRQ